MPGKQKEPRVSTGHRRAPVCLLPTGCCFDDARWQRIRAHFGERSAALTRADLRALFPGDPAPRDRPDGPAD